MSLIIFFPQLPEPIIPRRLTKAYDHWALVTPSASNWRILNRRRYPVGYQGNHLLVRLTPAAPERGTNLHLAKWRMRTLRNSGDALYRDALRIPCGHLSLPALWTPLCGHDTPFVDIFAMKSAHLASCYCLCHWIVEWLCGYTLCAVTG